MKPEDRIKNLERELELLKQEIKSDILVPDGIKIEWGASYKGIQFGKQCLLVMYDEDVYRVGLGDNSFLKTYKLIKCNREDLKCGDVAFRSDCEVELDATMLYRYCIILDDKRHVCTDGESCLAYLNLMSYNHWYKVVPV